MPVARYLQSTWASGEFDPLLASREDVAFFYSSAKIMDNVVALPQGGFKRREGLRGMEKQRGDFAYFDTAGYTITAPEGGTAANLTSEVSSVLLQTTGNIGTATEFVCAKIDTGSAERWSAVNITAALTGGLIATGTLAIQSSDDDVTYTTRDTITIGNTQLGRRFSTSPDTDLGTHRYWQIVILNPAADDYGSANVQLFGFASGREQGYSQLTTDPGPVKVRRITASITDEYWAVITDRNVDIYTIAGVWQTSVAIPHLAAAVADIKTSQQRDTLVLYHEDYPPFVVQRLDAQDDQWRSGEFTFTSVAQFPFEDSTTGGQNEIQELSFGSMTAGDRLVFEFAGDISAEVTWNGTPATNVTNFTTALEGLDDISDVTVTSLGSGGYEVEFTGVDGNTFFALLIIDLLTGSGVATTSRKQYGQTNREDLWSPARGYPKCGTFYQGRHWMGGFKARPDVIVGSRAGDFTGFKEDFDPIATSPLVLSPDIDEQVTVENIYPGRNLQIFTSSAEIFIPNEPITPTNIALKVTSKRGTSDKTQPVDVQGGTLFVDRNGTNLREFLFTEVEQSYTAEPISTLGGHLVQQPSEMALRKSVDTDEPTLLYLINTGRDRNFDTVPASLCTIDRAQQITAFCRITSGGSGEALAVAASQGGDVCMVWKRSLAGNVWNYIELLDEDHMGDHSEEIANPDLEFFSASPPSSTFIYTFASPTSESDIAVFIRDDSTDAWTRVEPDEYTLDLGTKTVELDVSLPVGKELAIAKRATSITITQAELNGIECYVHGDGRPLGEHTPASDTITISGDEGFFFNARVGLRMVPSVTLQAYKGQGGQSPTMKKQRIFRLLLNIERTINVAVGMEGATPRAVALSDWDSGTYDRDLEEILFTGTKRVSGIGNWRTEPRVVVTQTEPGPFLVRSVAYDIRF